MSTTPTRARAKPLSPDERRRAIVAATLPLLVEHGGAVSTKQVAAAAGVAEGTIFRVFPDKRALFRAAAEQAMDPEDLRADLAAALSATDGLRAQVVVAVEHLVARWERGMLVMLALRSLLAEPPGPPAFVVEANRRMLAILTDLLFAPYAADLRVAPDRAALVLRSLVFGAWHPGLPDSQRRLTPEEIADAVLGGIEAS